MKNKRPSRKIFIPYNVSITKDEYLTAKTLTNTGHDVQFLKPRLIKTPDILFFGREWEIKTPLGNNSRTLENIMRRALKQSPNIILDLRKIKLPESQCFREIERQIRRTPSINNVIVINKSQKVIDKFCNFEIIKT